MIKLMDISRDQIPKETRDQKSAYLEIRMLQGPGLLLLIKTKTIKKYIC